MRQLRTAHVELLERADQTRVVNELARALRQDLDSAQLVNRAAESVGSPPQSTAATCCSSTPTASPAVQGTWSSSPENAELPRPHSFVELPEALTTLLLETAQQLEPLQIERIDEDPRLGCRRRRRDLRGLGVRALAAVPIAFGDEVVGWLLLSRCSRAPGTPASSPSATGSRTTWSPR